MSAPTLTPQEWVIWSYRLLLDREPESDAVFRAYMDGGFSLDRLRRTLLMSTEFQTTVGRELRRTAEDDELLRRKARFHVRGLSSEPGFFTDFLGVKTRCSYLPPSYAQFSGHVEQPGDAAVPLHETAESLALMAAVDEAGDILTVVELGAGWGPWLVAGAAAARQRGKHYRLIGVEADPGHLDFMRTHMRDNGVDPYGQKLIHAVVGAEDGTAHFPVLPDPSADWGATAAFAGDGHRTATQYVAIPSIAIATALSGTDRVDLMHCDIQGAEADALTAAIDAVSAKVRRLVVGTHGRSIEERLHALLAGHGWTVEHDRACTFTQIGTAIVPLADGTQVWRNTVIS